MSRETDTLAVLGLLKWTTRMVVGTYVALIIISVILRSAFGINLPEFLLGSLTVLITTILGGVFTAMMKLIEGKPQ